jgi:hypothetical protein
MKSVISIVLFLASLFLMYLLFLNIQEPIKFQEELETRQSKVIKKLEDIRTAQEYYKDITGKYASSFDSLQYVLQTDSFRIIKVEGDPDDPNGEFIKTLIMRSAKDSIDVVGLDISDLALIPFTDNDKFSIAADTLTYQSTLVNVTEVGTRYKNFMGPFASKKYSKYDNSYNPDKMLKFGDMTSPNLSGNW